MSTTARLVALARPHAPLLGLATLLSLGALGAGVGLMALSAYLISKASLVAGFTAVALLVTGVRSLAISRAVLRYCERYTTHLATFRILTTLRVWFFSAIEPLAPARLQDRRTPDLLTRITADIDGLDQFYIRCLVTPIAAFLAMLLGVGILAAFDWRIGLVALLLLLTSGVVLPLLHLRLARHLTIEEPSRRSLLTVAVTDLVQGLPDTTAFGTEWRSLDEALRLDERLAAGQRRAGYLRALFSSVAAMLVVLGAVFVFALAAQRVEAGTLRGIYLALLPITFIASFEAAHLLAAAIERMNDGAAAGRRLVDLVDDTHPVSETIRLPRDHDVEFRDVHFAYSADEPVLECVTFNIPDGDILYVIGPSGSGKSTLFNLLLRFWEPQHGEIRVGGVDVSEMAAEELRSLFVVVPQNPYLFHTSVRDNLLLARGDATDDEIEAACRRAQIHETVMKLPDGYDSRVGENGFKLSGGERQRLAIARAFLKGAPILLLDEPTANLDTATEDLVWSALKNEMHGRTTIVITHDWSRVPPHATVLALDG